MKGYYYDDEKGLWAPPGSTECEPTAPEWHRNKTMEEGYTDDTVEEKYIHPTFYRPLLKFYRDPEELFELMTGPSTNFYVGPQNTTYTIPERLVCHYSDYTKACLASSFREGGANAVSLPDVDPDIFQWLWQWLYTGKMKVSRLWDWCKDERFVQACQVLCRVHFLGERLLFDARLLDHTIQWQLNATIEKAKTFGKIMPLTPEIVDEVLSESAPVKYCGQMNCQMNWENRSLRPFVLGNLRTFEFCTGGDWMEYAECFELDGAFAAELMVFLAGELKWAVERWEAQVGWPVDVAGKNLEYAKHDYYQCVVIRPKICDGVWLALRYMCTFAGCMSTDFRAYSQCFELDGEFAANILNYMALELLWIVEMWGWERGEEVDVAAEKEKEAQIAKQNELRDHSMRKSRQRYSW